MGFKITSEQGKARTGKLKTAHGTIETPFFTPVATRAVGKFIGTDDYKSMNSQALMCNAFVLSINPGTEIIKKFKGIHNFMNFDKPVYTDCGGFQMLRESFLLGTTSRGILFKNPTDGKQILLTPQKIMEIEYDIRSDAAMMLDDVSPYGSSKEKFVASLKNTHTWAELSLKHHELLDKNHKQMLYGIVQGGFFPDLRKKAAEFISGMDFDGIALGGLAIGETKEEMYTAIKSSMPFLAKEKPKHLLGLGNPSDIVECIGLGIDSFDSVFPTQNARHNTLFTWNGNLMIDKAVYKDDSKPIDSECSCFVCKNYSRAYLRYLSKIDEPTGKRYKTYHNLYFINELMKKARTTIQEGEFLKFRKSVLKVYRK